MTLSLIIFFFWCFFLVLYNFYKRYKDNYKIISLTYQWYIQFVLEIDIRKSNKFFGKGNIKRKKRNNINTTLNVLNTMGIGTYWIYCYRFYWNVIYFLWDKYFSWSRVASCSSKRGNNDDDYKRMTEWVQGLRRHYKFWE